MTFHQQRRSFFLFIYVLFIMFIAFSYRDYGISWDENFFVESGKYYASHFFDTQAIFEHFPKFHVLSHGALMDILYYAPLKLLELDENYEALHFIKALASSSVLILVFLILCDLTPTSFLPLSGVLLLVLSPRWLGDIFDNYMDGSSTILFALQMLVGLKLLLLSKLFQRSIKSQVWQIAAFGILAGVSFSHRSSLVFVPAIYFVLLFLQIRKRAEFTRFLVLLALFSSCFFTALWMVDPYVRSHGIIGIYDKITYSSSVKVMENLKNRFEGSWVPAGQLPWYYLPKWIGITTPLMTLILMGIGTLKLLNDLIQQRSTEQWTNAAFLLLSFALPVLATIVLHPTLFDAWRHFLFLTVPIVIIATVGLGGLFARLPNKLIKFSLFLMALGAVAIGIEMIQLHPYQYLYFNQSVGGLSGAADDYATEYWGKSNKEAVEWTQSQKLNNPLMTYVVFSCGNALSSNYFFSGNVFRTTNVEEADYFICYNRGKDHEMVPEDKTIHTIQRHNVPLNYIKETLSPSFHQLNQISKGELERIQYLAKSDLYQGHFDQASSQRISQGDPMRLKGWVEQIPAVEKQLLHILITLEDPKKVLVLGRHGFLRKDVAIALKDDRYLYSGWFAGFETDQFEPGTYQLKAWVYDQDTQTAHPIEGLHAFQVK